MVSRQPRSVGGGPLVALGIATLGSVGTFVYRTQMADQLPAGLPAAAAQAARDSLAGATAAAAGLPDRLATELLEVARQAFTSGLHAVAAVAAVVLAGVAILLLVALRIVPPVGQPQADSTTAEPSRSG